MTDITTTRELNTLQDVVDAVYEKQFSDKRLRFGSEGGEFEVPLYVKYILADDMDELVSWRNYHDIPGMMRWPEAVGFLNRAIEFLQDYRDAK